MKGRSTRYSSSLLWKKAQTCRERSRTEPASRTCLGLLIARLLSVNALRGRFPMQALSHCNDGSRAANGHAHLSASTRCVYSITVLFRSVLAPGALYGEPTAYR